jgi:hypothetical protein
LKTAHLTCWGWSDVSLSDAVEKGNQRAKAITVLWPKGDYDTWSPPERYSYTDRPLHEAVLDEWKNDAGETWAAITRNACGCEVLNTAAIMFVDVDLPDGSSEIPLARAFKRLFGLTGPNDVERQREAALRRIRATVERQPGFGVRVYRTRGGLRYLMTHSRVQPDSETTRGAMEALGADPKYVMLCKTQGCFRARLTPKPWRCGMKPLRIRYPWEGESRMHNVRMWCEDYSRKAAGFATCALIEQLGDPAMDAEMARVVEFHDKATRVGSNLELA